MAGLVAMVSLVALEYLAVATAMPVVARELHGASLYGLAFSGAMAASVVGTVAGGRWGDVRGPLAPLWIGTALFAAGLLVCGAAPVMEVFIAGRFVQGFGGALVSVALYVVVARAFPESDHPRIFSLFATAWVVPSIVGPALVGGITDTLGWRWVFLGVPLFTVPVAVLLWRGLSKAPVRGGQAQSAPGFAVKIAWGVLTAVGAGLMQYGSDGGLMLLLAGLLVLAVTLPRLLPPGTLRAARGLPTVVALRGLSTGGFYAAEVLVPRMLVQERGLSPLWAGVALTGGAVSWAVGSWLQGRRVFRQITNVRGGSALIAAGLIVTGTVTFSAVPTAIAYPAWVLTGLGMGLVYPTLSVLTLELSRPGEQGVNSSALQVGESVFAVMSVAVTSALFNALGGAYWAAYLFSLLMVVVAIGVAPRFRPAAAHPGTKALTGP